MRGTKPLLVFSDVVVWDSCEPYDPESPSCSQLFRDQCMKSTPDCALPVASAVRESILHMTVKILKTYFYFPPLIARGFFLLLFVCRGGQVIFILVSRQLQILQL